MIDWKTENLRRVLTYLSLILIRQGIHAIADNVNGTPVLIGGTAQKGFVLVFVPAESIEDATTGEVPELPEIAYIPLTRYRISVLNEVASLKAFIPEALDEFFNLGAEHDITLVRQPSV